MGKGEPSVPSRVSALEAHQQNISDRLSKLETLADKISNLGERLSAVEGERRAQAGQRVETVQAGIRNWTRLGVYVAILLGGLSLIVTSITLWVLIHPG